MGVELNVLLINLGSNSLWDVKVICHYHHSSPPLHLQETSERGIRIYEQWQEGISSSISKEEAGESSSHQPAGVQAQTAGLPLLGLPQASFFKACEEHSGCQNALGG